MYFSRRLGTVLLSALCCAVPCAADTTLASIAVPASAIPSPQEVDQELRNALIRAVNLHELAFNDQFDAQVWMVAMSARLQRFVKNEQERLELLKLIRQEAVISGLKPEIVLAVIEVESHFNRYAVSRVGAQGMMQVMPFWKKEIGRPDDNLIDTPTNLRYGCTILKHYLDREKGDLRRALARYNGSAARGPYGPYPELVFAAYEKRWKGGEL